MNKVIYHNNKKIVEEVRGCDFILRKQSVMAICRAITESVLFWSCIVTIYEYM